MASVCDPADAWVAGKQGREPESVCQSQDNRQWREAYNLGRQLSVFEQQLRDLDQELALLKADAGAPGMGQLELQRIKLVREIESISGVAQVRGWGEQVRVPPHE